MQGGFRERRLQQELAGGHRQMVEGVGEVARRANRLQVGVEEVEEGHRAKGEKEEVVVVVGERAQHLREVA